MRSSLLGVFFLALSLTQADHSVTKMLKEYIEEISRFLKYELVSDVKDNNGFIRENLKMTAETSNKIIDYVDKSMIEVADKVQNALEMITNKTKSNFNDIKENTSSNLNTLQKHVAKNEETIVHDFTKKLNNVVAKMESRMKQHEDFMTTSVAVCAEAFSHMSRGTVVYDNTFMKSVLIKGELVPDILDVKTGEFVVPKGGDGIYHISFGVLIDTVSPRTGISNARWPPRFVIKSSHGNKITFHEASQVWATVGVQNKRKDLVPASRSITLKLQEDDFISLEQMIPHAEQAYRITFCVHLVHPTLVSSVTWVDLPKPDALVLNLTATYLEPILQEFQVEDLKPTEQKPIITLPVLTNLKSPISPFVAGHLTSFKAHHSPEPTNPWLMIMGGREESDTGSGEGGFE